MKKTKRRRKEAVAAIPSPMRLYLRRKRAHCTNITPPAMTIAKKLFLLMLPHFTRTESSGSVHLQVILVSKEQGLSLVGPPVTALARKHSSNPG
jgi:hypothetical protein